MRSYQMCESLKDADVDLLLKSEPLDALMLMAEDPVYYLDLVENYNQLPDGTPIYLPYNLNVDVKRQSDGKLIAIKFKLSKNTQWYVVGYENGDEEATYLAFTKKITELIRFPPPTRGHLIEESLADPEPCPPLFCPTEVAIGGVVPGSEIVEIDCPMTPNIAERPVTEPRSTQFKMPGTYPIELKQSVPLSTDQLRKTDYIPEDEAKVLKAGKTTEPNDMAFGGLDDYVLALMEHPNLCRPAMLPAYQKLIRILSSPDRFIGLQLSLLPQATSVQQICMLNFLRDYTS